MSKQVHIDWAFVCMVVGGLLILAGGLGMGTMMGAGFGAMPMRGAMGALGYDAGWASAWTWWVLGVSAAAGTAVLLAAGRLRAGPEARSQAGVVSLVAGALSLLAMGGFVVGAIAAVAGGAIALGESAGRADGAPAAR